jgi:outer membrane protein OmpA-like peptidoglycan-associated protein
VFERTEGHFLDRPLIVFCREFRIVRFVHWGNGLRTGNAAVGTRKWRRLWIALLLALGSMLWGAVAARAADAPPSAACARSLNNILAHASIDFATGSATIDPLSARLLDVLVQALGACPGTIRVEGYTDSQGSAASNLALSQARAEAVRAALVERGVSAERLQSKGFGMERPVADNATAEGRARNRRIEFRSVDEPAPATAAKPAGAH